MKKFLVLAVLVLLFAVALAGSAKKHKKVAKPKVGESFKETRCVKKVKVTCKYIKECTKEEKYCKTHDYKTTEVCQVWAKRKIQVKQNVCLDWDKTSLDKCVKCKKYGVKYVEKEEAYCKEYKKEKFCKEQATRCVAHKVAKKCFRIVNKYELVGPLTCPAGQMLSFTLTGHTIKRSCVPTKPLKLVTCYSVLDPHDNDGKKAFEFQVEGDFLFARTSDGVVEVHQRLKRFSSSYTGTVAIAARINGRDVVEYSGGTFLLNGSPFTPKEGGVATQFPQGGYITITGTTTRNIEIFAPNGAKILYVDYNKVNANLYFYYPDTLTVEGICSGNDIENRKKTFEKGLFGFQYIQKDATPKPKKYTKAEIKSATDRCKGNNLTGDALKRCVFDVLAAIGHPGEGAKAIAIEKQVHEQRTEGKEVKVNKKQVVKAAVKAVKAAVKALPKGATKAQKKAAVHASVKAAVKAAPKHLKAAVAHAAAHAAVKVAKKK